MAPEIQSLDPMMPKDALTEYHEAHPSAVDPTAVAQWRQKKTQQRPINVYAPSYAKTCLPDAEWQRCKLESLRWRFGYYQHTPWKHIMQSAGDTGREFFREATSTTSLGLTGLMGFLILLFHLWVWLR